MKRARRSRQADERQRQLAEKNERLSDYSRRPAVSDNHIDAMSADSFPASDPPSFARKPHGDRHAKK